MLPLLPAFFLAVFFRFASAHRSAERVNYAEVRTRVSHAFEEKTHEMFEALTALQDLSQETSTLLANMEAQCGMQR